MHTLTIYAACAVNSADDEYMSNTETASTLTGGLDIECRGSEGVQLRVTCPDESGYAASRFQDYAFGPAEVEGCHGAVSSLSALLPPAVPTVPRRKASTASCGNAAS